MLELDPPEHSPFVDSMINRIERHAGVYAKEVDHYFQPARQRIGTRPTEQVMLDSFNLHVETVLVEYNPPGLRRRGDSLVFRRLYTADPDSPDDEDGGLRTRMLTALLAAEIEQRGPLRLSSTQSTLLADTYEKLGGDLIGSGLPEHAALAYRRAMRLHRQNEDDQAEDRCGLALARARSMALPLGRRRIGRAISNLLCGYGYRPFRLFAWIAAQLVLFTTAIVLVTGVPAADITYMTVTSYLNPLGASDIADLNSAGQVLFAIEPWAGTVSLSVFFALLVRRWFRI
ncbi:hypothetical protein [Nocardia australiensis]|uniref:hypothetical protein n=1 Tax=Nocardia australiensis TaxID=2887191 RepID=UPI001D13B0DD|nr:hypothetical protein [Nocardia australiensis]